MKKICLADNQFNDEDEVIKAMDFCMSKNKTLTKYDFRYNNITSEGKNKLRIQIANNVGYRSEADNRDNYK